MKVLHVVAESLQKGAARGALWLHQGLLARGVSSKILLQKGPSIGDDIISLGAGKWRTWLSGTRAYLDKLPLLSYPKREPTIFSTGFAGIDISRHRLYDWADLIHLHWINNGFVSAKKIPNIKKPLVWTFRDMWPLTGGCHIALECDRYRLGCGCCPYLRSRKENDLSRKVLHNKRGLAAMPNLHIIAISRWLKTCVTESDLFRDYPRLDIIHNGVDSSRFTPSDKTRARHALGLPHDRSIVLLFCAGTREKWKGTDIFYRALPHLKGKKYFFLLVGNADTETLDHLSLSYKVLDYQRDDRSLARVYSAAHVYVTPAIQESFGKTLIESLACGTPVVCFDATGPADIIDHKKDGYKAAPFEPRDLAAGITWTVENKQHQKLCKTGREKAEKIFDISVIAKQYHNVYNKLLF